VRVLVVTATLAEVAPLMAKLQRAGDGGARATRYRAWSHDLDLLVTGVGMVATAVWSSRRLVQEPYDLALNLGLCGSFRSSLSPGTVVHVVSDSLPELGAEDGDAFLSLQQLKLIEDDESPFSGGRLVNSSPPGSAALARLPAAHGITVNTVHGNERSIAAVVGRVDADVESMEGAAFMYACLVHGLPFAQIRAVSNRVERRNRDAWRIPQAVAGLCEVAQDFLEHA